MKTPEQTMELIDYSQENASDGIVPRPAILKSLGWNGVHLELHQQPTFATTEHQHTMHAIAYGLAYSSGVCASGTRVLDGKLERERRNSGDLAIIPAGISHRCSWDAQAQFMILAIEPALLQQVGQDWVNPDQIELIPQFMNRQDSFIQGIFSALSAEAEMGGIGSYLLIDSLKTALAIHLLRHYCATQPKLSTYADGLSQSRLQKVIEYIHEYLDQNLKLVDLSEIAQISPYHFLRLFKKSMGVTPHRYILQCRIDLAKSLLQHSELNIAEIAVRTGFCDQSHLTRAFKRLVGVTPKQLLQNRLVANKALRSQ
jgi:AraC family transcriptional regulator